MAVKLRILKDKERFQEELRSFADLLLHGNLGILSHVLWYIRKAYCSKNDCHDCPLFQYCFTYELKWQFDELAAPTRQNPNPKKEWIENKMYHATSRIVTLKKPPTADQAKLTTFFSV